MAACTSQSKFQHEVEEFEDYVGESDNKIKYDKCEKNPGHENFKSVYNLKMEDVPPAFQSDKGMKDIKTMSNLTVKLQTNFISYGREGLTWYGGEPYPYSDEKYKGNTRMVRTGTGYINHIKMYKDKPCRCKECKNSTHPVVGCMKVRVETARHVVFDKSECVHTTVEVFYDTPDKNGVVVLDGCDSSLYGDGRPDNDKITVVCVTHDTDGMDKLKNKIGLHRPRFKDWFDDRFSTDSSKPMSGLTVSHPHGFYKQISFGQPLFSIYSFRKDHPEPEGFVRCRLKLPRIKHNLPPDTSKMEDKLLENVTCPSMVEPGVEYLLPDTSKICLPGVPHYSMSMYERFEWNDIPEGWRYEDSNGKFVPFPPGMEILCELEEHSTMTYDIPTCPGSSGAYVYIGGGWYYPRCVHSGADEVRGNKGIRGYFLF